MRGSVIEYCADAYLSFVACTSLRSIQTNMLAMCCSEIVMSLPREQQEVSHSVIAAMAGKVRLTSRKEVYQQATLPAWSSDLSIPRLLYSKHCLVNMDKTLILLRKLSRLLSLLV